MAQNPTMNFQAYLEDAWRIIKQEPLVIVGGGFLYQLLFFLTQGVVVLVAGPLLGSYLLLIILYLRENRRPSFSDLFTGFKQFGRLFPYFLVLLIIFIGFALLVVPGLVFLTWWIYVLPLMVDRNMSFSEAMRTSMNKVNETGFFMHFVFLFLISIVPLGILVILSSIAPFLTVLSLLLPPLQFGCLASLYLDKFGPGETEVQHEEARETGAAAAEVPAAVIDEGATEKAQETGEDMPGTGETPGAAGSAADEALENSGEEGKEDRRENP